MTKDEAKPQAAPGAIKVEAASTVQGPAATTISVEVDESKLGPDGKSGGDAQRAVAVVSQTRNGQQEWKEEELIHSGHRLTEDSRVLKTFTATVSGSTDDHAPGVAVKVQTPSGAVWANGENTPPSARDADKAPKKSKP